MDGPEGVDNSQKYSPGGPEVARFGEKAIVHLYGCPRGTFSRLVVLLPATFGNVPPLVELSPGSHCLSHFCSTSSRYASSSIRVSAMSGVTA
uniref:Uncharacterized protein n=1 Tax=Lutzomyia longipalpis TaxID=7200 RepID=A0A1B0CRK9_LUTLO